MKAWSKSLVTCSNENSNDDYMFFYLFLLRENKNKKLLFASKVKISIFI